MVHADFALNDGHVAKIAYGDFGCLMVTGTSLAMEPSRGATFRAMALAREADLAVVLDVDYRPYSWASKSEASEICARAATLSDIVIGNDVEFAVMAGEHGGLDLARDLAAEGARIVVYKMGEKGSVTFCDGQSFETGIYAVTALKPTGAGDAFMGGLLHRPRGRAGPQRRRAARIGRGGHRRHARRLRAGHADRAELDAFLAGYPAGT